MSQRAAAARRAIPPSDRLAPLNRSSRAPPIAAQTFKMYRLFIAALMLSACSAYMPAAPAGSRLADRGGRDAAATLAPRRSRVRAPSMNSEYETFYEMFDPVKAAVWILPCALLARWAASSGMSLLA